MKLVRGSLYEGKFETEAKKALSQTKEDPDLSIYHYFGEKGDMNMLRALRSTLKRVLNGMDPTGAFYESCDINGVIRPQDMEELKDTLVKMFDVDIMPFDYDNPFA
jgi:hypothetical protein